MARGLQEKERGFIKLLMRLAHSYSKITEDIDLRTRLMKALKSAPALNDKGQYAWNFSSGYTLYFMKNELKDFLVLESPGESNRSYCRLYAKDVGVVFYQRGTLSIDLGTTPGARSTLHLKVGTLV